jgi:hypothetical protein
MFGRSNDGLERIVEPAILTAPSVSGGGNMAAMKKLKTTSRVHYAECVGCSF